MSNAVSNNIYITILGDIVESKSKKDRNTIQKKLKQIIATINDVYSSDIVAPFSIIYGDGIQGLLKVSENIMSVINDIEHEMYPVKLRFGIGVGQISTELSTNVYEVDGSCFHYARKMLEEVVKNESKRNSFETNIMLYSGPENNEIDSLINTIYALAYAVKKRWTVRQVNIIKTYEKMHKSQIKTAQTLGVNKATVSKSLAASDYFSYVASLESVSKYLSKGEVNIESE